MSDEHGVPTGKQYPGNAPSATTGEQRHAEAWQREHDVAESLNRFGNIMESFASQLVLGQFLSIPTPEQH